MLKGLSPLLTPYLLHTLASMGHGDEIVLADAAAVPPAVAALTEILCKGVVLS